MFFSGTSWILALVCICLASVALAGNSANGTNLDGKEGPSRELGSNSGGTTTGQPVASSVESHDDRPPTPLPLHDDSTLDDLVRDTYTDPTMDLFNEALLNFGNYEEGDGTACDFQFEQYFYNRLSSLDSAAFQQQVWNSLTFRQLRSLCNRFNYLRCDQFTGRCTCGLPNTFWSPFEPGDLPGKCRIRLGVKNTCDTDTEAHWSFQNRPFSSAVLQLVFNETMKPVPVEGSFCDKNGGRAYACRPGSTCITGQILLEEDIERVKARVEDSDWSFQPNYICNSSLNFALTRGGRTPFGLDFEAIRKIVREKNDGKSMATTQHCNPLAYKECRFGVCDCPSGENGEEDLYVLQNNMCVVDEGGVCSKYFWYNGNWERVLQECVDGLKCRQADNNEKLDYICCDPEKDFNQKEGKGRCKWMLTWPKHKHQHSAAGPGLSDLVLVHLVAIWAFL